jgi:hypothetical protein
MTTSTSITNPIITLFYSNYSPNCKALLQRLKNTNLASILSIKYINIDNETVRKVVSKKFSVVPAMVVLINDEISLYSGTNVFEWFNIYEQNLSEENVAQSQKEVNDSTPHTQDIASIANISTVHPVVVEEKPKKKTILELAAELSKAREKNEF